MPTAIDVSFRADISNLTQQLGTLPGITEKQAKEMVKGLESNIKKAEKAAVAAAKKSEKAWGKTRGQFKGARDDSASLSSSMANLGEKSGDTDSALKALGGAVGVFSPAAEKAFTAIGDLSGGLEGGIKSIMGSLGPMALLTGAVAAGMAAWKHYSDKLEAAEQKIKDAAAATQEMIRITKALKQEQDTAQLALAISLGEEEAEMMMARQAELAAESKFREKLERDLQREGAVREKLRVQRNKDKKAIEEAGSAGTKELRSIMSKSKATKRLERQLKGVQEITAKTRKEQEAHASVLFQVAQNTANASKSTGKSTDATKDQKDAIAELIKEMGQFDPKLSEMDQMSALLDRMTEASEASTTAAVRLSPVIADLESKMENLAQTQAAESIEKLSKEAQKVGAVADPIANAADLLARLKEEADKSAQAFEALAPDIERIGAHIQELQATSDPIELIESDSIKAQIQNVQILKAEIQRLGEAQEEYTRIHGESSEVIATQQATLTEKLNAEQQKVKQGYISAFTTATQAAAQFAQAAAQFATLHTNAVVSSAEEELEAREENSSALESALRETEAEISKTEDKHAKARLEAQALNLQQQIATEQEATEQLREVKNKEIVKAFKQQQALQVSQAIMATATAVIRAWELGPIVGPIMSTAAAALGAAQVATIRAQEPPTAHLGGLIGNSDETMVKARTGEGVLTAQGVQAIGGAQGLANANAGMASGGGQIVVQQVYRHRVLDTVIQDSINKGGPITTAINRRNRRGRRNPFRRSG